MEKVKRWILVLSSCCLGSAVAIGFASYKITNPIKNETSFVIKGDGDVSENNQAPYIVRDTSKGTNNSGIELPVFSDGGIVSDAVYAPDSWKTSDTSGDIYSGPLGYKISDTGHIKVYLKLGRPHDKRAFTLTGAHRSGNKVSTLTSLIYPQYINHVSVSDLNGNSYLDKDLTPKKDSTCNSYAFDDKIDVSSITSETIDLVIDYTIKISGATKANKSSLKTTSTQVSISFSASYAIAPELEVNA